jgi:predicted DNA-binding transcriptional regulator AlpA
MQQQQALPDTGFVRLPQVLSVFPVSRSTWWAGVKVGKYPSPVKLGPNTTAWRAEDILQLIKSHNAEPQIEAAPVGRAA